MREPVKVLLFVIGLTAYLNIGWALGTYMHKNVELTDPQDRSAVAVYFAGPKSFLVNEPLNVPAPTHSPLPDQVAFSIFWPLGLVFITLVWLVYGGYFVLWLIFAGGLAKLIGLG